MRDRSGLRLGVGASGNAEGLPLLPLPRRLCCWKVFLHLLLSSTPAGPGRNLLARLELSFLLDKSVSVYFRHRLRSWRSWHQSQAALPLLNEEMGASLNSLEVPRGSQRALLCS